MKNKLLQPGFLANSLPAVYGPLLGLVYFLVLPVVVLGALIFFGGQVIANGLTALWHRMRFGHTS